MTGWKDTWAASLPESPPSKSSSLLIGVGELLDVCFPAGFCQCVRAMSLTPLQCASHPTDQNTFSPSNCQEDTSSNGRRQRASR